MSAGDRQARVKRVARVAALLTVLAAATSASPARAEAGLSQDALLGRLTDPVAALAPLPAGVRVVQASSHDLTGGNTDGGSYGGAITAIGLPPTYVRHEDGGYVLLDVRRPGCLVRQWMTANGANQGDVSGFGRLQLFFDGESSPRFDEPASDFFAGRDARYPPPLVGDSATSSGGNYSYVPFCFAHALKLRVTTVPGDASGWWQSTLLLAPEGTPVETYRGADARAGGAALAAAGAPPAGRPAARASRELAVGEVAQLARLRGAGTLRQLRFRVAPFDAATLGALSLRVTADGAPRPQIDVPLAPLFGDGLEPRPLRSLAFGMAPADEEGYFALPIPYRRGVRVEVAAERPANVRLDAWSGAPSPPAAGTLYGERRVETAVQGSDFSVLRAQGSGRLAALVLDVLDGGPFTGTSGGQFFMEGDERIHVDGARSPAIHGTGTEDTFNGGFYYRNGAFTLPTHGAGPFVSRSDGHGAQSQYRVFGGDGVLWTSALDFGMEHGGGDEWSGETVAATTFSYRSPESARRTDAVAFGNPASESAHSLAGSFERRSLTAYFEGDHDGNLPASTVVFGGTYYPAPPPEASPEGVAGTGVAFSEPLSVTLRVDPRAQGVVLRRLTDQAPPLVPLKVSVDGAAAGTWTSASATPNPSKRWLEDDFALPPRLTAGRSSLRVTLTPEPGGTATLYGLEAR